MLSNQKKRHLRVVYLTFLLNNFTDTNLVRQLYQLWWLIEQQLDRHH